MPKQQSKNLCFVTMCSKSIFIYSKLFWIKDMRQYIYKFFSNPTIVLSKFVIAKANKSKFY